MSQLGIPCNRYVQDKLDKRFMVAGSQSSEFNAFLGYTT